MCIRDRGCIDYNILIPCPATGIPFSLMSLKSRRKNAPTAAAEAFSIQCLSSQQNSAGALIPINTKAQRFPQIAQLEVVVPIDLKCGQ